MAKKLAAICLVLLMVLTTLGASYGSWTQNLYTNATVSTALPPVVNASGANAGTTSAVLNGSLAQEAPGGAPVTVGFKYWPSTNPADVHTVTAGSVASLNGTFSATASGLSSGTTYNYQSTGVGFFTVASATSSFTTGASPALAVTTGSLPDGIVGTSYNQALQASGGSGSYTGWAIISGSLPPGLGLSNGNIISGTPTTAGTFSFTAQVTDSTPTTASSVSLSIVIHAAATQLVFIQQPLSTTPGTAFAPNVTVKVADAGGNTITTSSAVVSISINNNPSSGTLSGMQTVNAVNGVATFKYLSIDKAGTGYTLTASSSGLTGAASTSFNIGARTTGQLSIETLANGSGTVVPAQSFIAGNGGTVTAYAIERDASNNFVANVSATWSLTNITSGVASGDLVPSGDGKSATFTDTAHLVGSATLHAVWNGLSSDSARITITPNLINRLIVTLPGQTFTAGTGNSGSVTAQTAGHLFNIVSITATDVYFNVVTSYSGASTINYSGPAGSPTYTTSVNFTNGVSTTTLATTLTIAETTTITVNDGFTSGPASSSLTVNPATPLVYVPITLTNTQTTAVAGGTQVSITLNWLNYLSYLDNPVDNYVFCNSAGVPLYSWLESGTANTSTSAVVWLKLDSNGIPAKVGSTNGTITVYLGFYQKSTNKLGSNNSNYTGWAPNLSGTYGQHDNGANVFANYYRGDSTTGWSVVGTAGATPSAPTGSASAFGTKAFYANSANGNYLNINAGYSTTSNYIIQYYTYTTGLGNLFFSASSAGAGTMSRTDSRGSTNYSGFAKTTSWTSWLAPSTSTLNSPSTWYQWSIVMAGNGTQIADYYTTAFSLGTLGTTINALGSTYTDSATETYSPAGSYIGLVGDALGASSITYWNGVLIRVYPPNGIMPTSTTGNLLTTIVPTTINIDSNINWSAITTGSGIGGQPSSYDTINVGVTNNTTLTVDVSNAVCGNLVLGHHTADKTGTLVFNNGSNLTVNNLSVGAAGGGAGIITMTSGGTLNISNAVTVNQAGTWTQGTGTVAYNGTGDQTVDSSFFASYNNLTLSGSGNKSTAANLTVGGNLDVGTGATFATGTNFTLGVTGTTSVTGTLTLAGTGTKTFTRAVTINSGATWNNSGNSAITFRGGITNSGTFTAGTGIQTFDTNAQALSGTLSLPSVTVTGITLINNGTLTVGTALAGTGGLTNAAAHTLNIGGTSTITTLTATATGNTVAYTNSTGGQTIVGTTYATLTLSNTSGTDTASGAIAATTLNTTSGGTFNLSTYALSGTTTVSNAGAIQTQNTSGTPLPTGLTWGGTAQYNAASGSQTVMAGTYSTLSLSNTSGIDTASGAIAATTLNTTAGGTFNLGTYALSGTSTVSNAGTIQTQNTSGTALPTGLTWGGTVQYNAATGSQTVMAGTYATLTLSNTSGTDTAGGSTTATTLNTTSGGTFTNGSTLTVNTTLAGTGTLTNTGTLNFGGASITPTLTATATGNTVNYTGTSQTLKVTSYSNLTLSGGAENFGAITAIGGNLTLSGSATATTGAALTVGGNLNIGDGTTFTAAGYALTVSGTTTVGAGTSGILTISSATGTKTFTGAVTINNGGAITESAAAALSFGSDVTINGTLTENGAAVVGIAGSLTNNGTYTASTGVHTFSGTTKTISGTATNTIPSVAVTGTYTNNGTLTVGTALAGTGGLTNAATGVLNIGGPTTTAITITTLTATAAGNTVNYTGAAQTVKATTYVNLGLSGTGAKTTTGITVNGILDYGGPVAVTISAVPTYGTGATLKYDKTAAITAGVEWSASLVNLDIAGTGTITSPSSGSLAVTGTFTVESGASVTVQRPFTVSGATNISGSLTFSSATVRANTFTGDVTLNSGSSWIASAAAHTYTITGNFTNNATTFTASTGVHTFSGSGKTISGSTTTSIPNVAVTGTITNNGTLTVTIALTGSGTLTNGTTGTLNFGGSSITPTLIATANGNTVNYNRAGTQTVKATTYYDLTLYGTATSHYKTIGSGTVINNMLTISGTGGNAPMQLATGVTISVNALTYGTTRQLAGTYGNTNSSATYKSNTYFRSTSSYTGILNVTH